MISRNLVLGVAVALLLLGAPFRAPALAVLLNPSAEAQQVAPPSGQVKLIEIDGKKNPEMIPEHVVWRQVFRFLASRSTMPPPSISTLKHELKSLSEHDLQMLFAAADLYMAIEKSFQQRMQQRFDALKADKQPLEVMVAARREIELENRYATLRLADMILEALPFDSRGPFTTWSLAFKSSISVTVPASDLAFFRLPR